MPATADHGEVSPETKLLSEYITGVLARPLPAAVAERATLHLIDTLAAMVSGTQLPAGRAASRYMAQGGPGGQDAGVVGTGLLASAAGAALANGMAAHADESDDIHPVALGHPGAQIVPAVLALAERDGRSGRDLLRSMVVGYDVGMRVLRQLQHGRLPGQQAACKGGALGAAAGCAALVGLDARRVRYALSYAAQQAAGLMTVLREREHVEKAFVQGGMPAHVGITSALMAGSGFIGVEDEFSGDPSFFSVFAPQGSAAGLIRDLGTDFEVMHCAIKPLPVATSVQGPLHITGRLLEQNQLAPDSVAQVVVRLSPRDAGNVSNRRMPDVCIEHLLALRLADGKLTLDSVHDAERMHDPAVLRARARIQVVSDKRLSSPAWGRSAVEMQLHDGRVLSGETHTCPGGEEDPLSRSAVIAKARDLMSRVLMPERATALLSALLQVEELDDIRSLRPLYS